jgi:hypothetical protein
VTDPDQPAARAEAERHDRHVSTLRAELARRGYSLFIVNATDGGSAFLVQRWDRSCELSTLVEVEAFLARVSP